MTGGKNLLSQGAVVIAKAEALRPYASQRQNAIGRARSFCRGGLFVP
ncbi:MAG: hypothetical protein ACJAQW_002187 [Paracoccaceae bacterium]|jgi:hypothetical protein